MIHFTKDPAMPIASVGSFAELVETVEACLQTAEGGKHRAYHLIMEFHKRGIEVSVRPVAASIHESSSDLGHG